MTLCHGNPGCLYFGVPSPNEATSRQIPSGSCGRTLASDCGSLESRRRLWKEQQWRAEGVVGGRPGGPRFLTCTRGFKFQMKNHWEQNFYKQLASIYNSAKLATNFFFFTFQHSSHPGFIMFHNQWEWAIPAIAASARFGCLCNKLAKTVTPLSPLKNFELVHGSPQSNETCSHVIL